MCGGYRTLEIFEGFFAGGESLSLFVSYFMMALKYVALDSGNRVRYR